jgi:translation elongation factor EF-Ts
MPGLVQSYIHHNNNGGCLVGVNCETDFAAETSILIDFTRRVAMLSYGFKTTQYCELSFQYADIETERLKLEEELKEKIKVKKIIILTVDDNIFPPSCK